jgi:hypothetical protein
MSVLAEVEEKAMSLTPRERGRLASKLIASLPGPFADDEDEDWIEEALRRSREMDENPDSVMTHEEFFGSLQEFLQKK